MKSIEIYVRDVAKDADGRTVIVAVPNNHHIASVGDCFVSCYEICREDILSGAVEPNRLNIESISLTMLSRRLI